MKIIGYRRYLVFAVATVLSAVLFSAARAEMDNRLYADLLGPYVHNGVVDYAGLKKAESQPLPGVPAPHFRTLPRRSAGPAAGCQYYDWSLNDT